jgi:NADH-quinone oxidoreductase subunit E
MFRQEPYGAHHIRVCRTLSCAMAGAYSLLNTFCRHTNIDPEVHEHGSHVLKSPDGKYSVEFVECLASCGTGPVCMIDDDFYEAVSESEVPQLLQKYQ